MWQTQNKVYKSGQSSWKYGWVPGRGGRVSSTIFNIYQSQDCLGVQKISLF